MGKKIVIVGTGFAGYTAALELRAHLSGEHEITVLAPEPEFLFTPSLVWVPFGLREKKEIAFDVSPVFDQHRIKFVAGWADSIDLAGKRVRTAGAGLAYDYLLIATGSVHDFGSVPGLGPDENSWALDTYVHANKTQHIWDEVLAGPGPIVIGATQGASCFTAAYEFLLNVRHQLEQHKLSDQAPLTFITPEPYLAHFGIGGFGSSRQSCERLFEKHGITIHTNTVVKEVKRHQVLLASGEVLPSSLTMLIPRFVGAGAVRATPGLADEEGFIAVEDTFEHPSYAGVYAAGGAVRVTPRAATPVPCGLPVTGYPSEQMAKTAAWNIAASIQGETDRHHLSPRELEALCVMDTGIASTLLIGEHALEPRALAAVVPGPQTHWAKLAFETQYMTARKRGQV